MHGIHPLALGMRCGNPVSAVASSRQLELRIFKQVQWKSRSPGLRRPAHLSLLILVEMSNRSDRDVSFGISKDHKLMSLVAVEPVGVLQTNIRQRRSNEIDWLRR